MLFIQNSMTHLHFHLLDKAQGVAEGDDEFGFGEAEETDPFGAEKLDLYGHVFPPRERHNTLAFVGCLEPTGDAVGK